MKLIEFIEKAIEGGWETEDDDTAATMLLDPESWQAVGKVEGWKDIGQPKEYKRIHQDGTVTSEIREPWQGWRQAMHRFIDALCDGKDLEEALNETTV